MAVSIKIIMRKWFEIRMWGRLWILLSTAASRPFLNASESSDGKRASVLTSTKLIPDVSLKYRRVS